MGVGRRIGLLGGALLCAVALVGPARSAFPGTNGQIAYISPDGALDAISPGSGAISQLLPPDTSSPRGAPTWAPDGRSIAYIQLDGTSPADDFNYVRYRLASGVVSSWTGIKTDDVPSWTPDSAQLLSAGQIESSDGTGYRQLPLLFWNSLSSSLSPDGSKVAYVSYPDDSIGIANFDGSDAHVIVPGPVGGGCGGAGDDAALLSWSPDGSKLAYCSGHFALTIVNVDGSDLHTILTNVVYGRVSWSPDGSKLVFPSTHVGEPQHALETVNADGSDPQFVRDSSGNFVVGVDPDWGRVPTAPPTTTPPAPLAAPTIDGNVSYGHLLTASAGSWGGDPVRIYTYQWKRCPVDGGSCESIPGATTPVYGVTADDVGARLRVVVNATNAAGSSFQTAMTDVVQKGNEPTTPSSGGGSGSSGGSSGSSSGGSNSQPSTKVTPPPVIKSARAWWVESRKHVQVRVRVTACNLIGRTTLFATDWTVVRKKASGVHRRHFAVGGTRSCRTTTRTWTLKNHSNKHLVALRVRAAAAWSKPVRVTVR